MHDNFYVAHYNYPLQATPEEGPFFQLHTCQRSLFLCLDISALDTVLVKYPEAKVLQNQEAYQKLLSIVCGIESQMMGENEIVHQFKQAYDQFLQSPSRCTHLMKVIEKILKDSKEIRTKYLKGIGTKTYSGIARSIVREKGNKKGDHPVLVLGTGNLSQDMINQFKKTHDIHISGRNDQVLHQLTQEHQLRPLSWGQFERYSNYSFIINTIGTNETLFCHEFFKRWQKLEGPKSFIDFGSPSPVSITDYPKDELFKLDHILKRGVLNETSKREKIHLARKAIVDLSRRRLNYFQRVTPLTSEQSFLRANI